MEETQNKFYGWKQPIPTNLSEIFGEDYRSLALYKELIYRACNTDNSIVILRLKTVKLMRGQVLYGRNKFAKYLCWNGSTTDRALVKLGKVYNLVNNKRSNDYTIVTLFYYEDIIGMNNQLSNLRTSDEQVVDTSKSIESIHSDDIKSRLEKNGESQSSKHFESVGSTLSRISSGYLKASKARKELET